MQQVDIMEIKTNCYTCKHRGTVCGSAHSSCTHPITENSVLISLVMMKLAMGIGSVNPTGINVVDKARNISVPLQDWNEHGIRSGWIQWPFNFDPTWLNNCMLYENKDGSTEENDAIRLQS